MICLQDETPYLSLLTCGHLLARAATSDCISDCRPKLNSSWEDILGKSEHRHSEHLRKEWKQALRKSSFGVTTGTQKILVKSDHRNSEDIGEDWPQALRTSWGIVNTGTQNIFGKSEHNSLRSFWRVWRTVTAASITVQVERERRHYLLSASCWIILIA